MKKIKLLLLLSIFKTESTEKILPILGGLSVVSRLKETKSDVKKKEETEKIKEEEKKPINTLEKKEKKGLSLCPPSIILEKNSLEDVLETEKIEIERLIGENFRSYIKILAIKNFTINPNQYIKILKDKYKLTKTIYEKKLFILDSVTDPKNPDKDIVKYMDNYIDLIIKILDGVIKFDLNEKQIEGFFQLCMRMTRSDQMIENIKTYHNYIEDIVKASKELNYDQLYEVGRTLFLYEELQNYPNHYFDLVINVSKLAKKLDKDKLNKFFDIILAIKQNNLEIFIKLVIQIFQIAENLNIHQLDQLSSIVSSIQIEDNYINKYHDLVNSIFLKAKNLNSTGELTERSYTFYSIISNQKLFNTTNINQYIQFINRVNDLLKRMNNSTQYKIFDKNKEKEDLFRLIYIIKKNQRLQYNFNDYYDTIKYKIIKIKEANLNEEQIENIFYIINGVNNNQILTYNIKDYNNLLDLIIDVASYCIYKNHDIAYAIESLNNNKILEYKYNFKDYSEFIINLILKVGQFSEDKLSRISFNMKDALFIPKSDAEFEEIASIRN
jgi:hypothetical protein